MTAFVGPQSDAIVRLQRRTVRVLVASQILGGIGVGSGVAVISLLAYELSGTESLSGVPSTASTLGAAMAAFVIARIATAAGRRPGLVLGYAVGSLGAALAVVAAVVGVFGVHVLAAFAFGWANAANLQARYAATDLAADDRRASALSTVLWATTVGAVLGPNLTGPGSRVAAALGLPDLSGPYVFSFGVFVGAALLQAWGLRPDPLLTARARTTDDEAATPPLSGPSPVTATKARESVRGSLRAIVAVPPALTALVTIAVAHATMMGVMFMTPVHMGHHGASLRLVGLTISLHIAGMYALSPIVGHLADRLGRRIVLLAGLCQLGVAVVLAATTAPFGISLFQAGLVLLGTGWSSCVVAGSALLTESLVPEERPAAQGASDVVMSLAGGAGGVVGGIVMAAASYEALAACALLLVAIPGSFILRHLPTRRAGIAAAQARSACDGPPTSRPR